MILNFIKKCLTFQTREDLPFNYCLDSSTNYLKSTSIDIDPYPVHIATGSNVTITLNFDLLKALEAGSKVDLLFRLKGTLQLEFPCIEVDGFSLPIGSCTYEITDLLNVFQLCPEHCPDGQENTLPLNPGQYKGKPNSPLKLTS